jgi:micrococcal nuclease
MKPAAMGVAVVAAVTAVATSLIAWWCVPLVAAGWALARAPRPVVAQATIGAGLGWTMLLALNAVAGDVALAATRMGAVLEIPGPALVAATVGFGMVLAASGASLTAVLVARAPRAPTLAGVLALITLAQPLMGQASDSAHVRRSSLPLAPSRPIRATESCAVQRIVDGDTLVCQGGLRVRLIGIDTPELSQAPFGEQARGALARLAPVGSTVLLERDVELTDRYGRRLAYVWRDGLLVNWQMVSDGWAVLLTYPPNVQYVEPLQEAHRRARHDQAGLWAAGGFTCAPVDRRRRRCE